MTVTELYMEAFCGLVCPFPWLNVPDAFGTPQYTDSLYRRKKYLKRKQDATLRFYKEYPKMVEIHELDSDHNYRLEVDQHVWDAIEKLQNGEQYKEANVFEFNAKIIREVIGFETSPILKEETSNYYRCCALIGMYKFTRVVNYE